MKATYKELPMHDLTKIKGWESLETAEQSKVKQEAKELDGALLSAGLAKLAIGEHLYNIREVLEPKRMFTTFLESITSFSRATAYRYIDTYLATKTVLPEPVVKVAMLRGMDNINLELVKSTPPPKTTNVVTINEYLDRIEANGNGEPRELETDPDTLKKESYNYVCARFRRLPNRSKANWLRSLISMLFTEMGVSGPQSVEPSAVPESYRRTVGRPRKNVA